MKAKKMTKVRIKLKWKLMVAVAAPATAKKNKKIGNTQHATPSKQRDESAYVKKYVW